MEAGVLAHRGTVSPGPCLIPKTLNNRGIGKLKAIDSSNLPELIGTVSSANDAVAAGSKGNWT